MPNLIVPLSDREMEAVQKWAERFTISPEGVLRNALRLYDLRSHAIEAGYPEVRFHDHEGNPQPRGPALSRLAFD